jgi:hypothetical protein
VCGRFAGYSARPDLGALFGVASPVRPRVNDPGKDATACIAPAGRAMADPTPHLPGI